MVVDYSSQPPVVTDGPSGEPKELFGGYSIYLPELFPTRLRSTGTSFCYNVGRMVAAAGPLSLGLLTSRVYHGPNALRYAGLTMCLVFLVGLAALPFAPETKGKPLPE